ncbi:HEAT repeat domain-containing protein [Micromonospora sp. WMMD980]|uniref:HEAT repeat domain-containing protein n=1 Tax=Micromonospora sp. WMMD980 TaxID=3016088 RepID=UPI002417F4BD|nr:HEAT repeat domain-containing protein [Micromonospora sp. WMMD980]MDG4801317.1 HEAT repeat domain-containing protein [Micromonospora sp. WMMD980]
MTAGDTLTRPRGGADRAAVRAVVLPLLHDADRSTRRAALWALDDVHEPSDLATLREALTDPDPVIRRTALSSLPAVDTDPQAYALVLTALRDPDEWVRHHAVLRLAWSAPPGCDAGRRDVRCCAC